METAFTHLPLHSAPPHQGAASVQQIEQRGFNAWPAPRSAVVGDWLLRSAAGYTKRANSANALQPGAVLTPQLLREIEAHYARQQLPCIFRISPLVDEDADALLQTEGYQWVDPSIVMQRAAQAGDAAWEPAAGLQLQLDADFQQSWLEGHGAAGARPDEQKHAHQMILQSIGMRCAYASLVQGGEVRA